MPVLQAIPYDLELSKLALPKEPKVQRIQVADYSDAEGKDALRIKGEFDLSGGADFDLFILRL